MIKYPSRVCEYIERCPDENLRLADPNSKDLEDQFLELCSNANIGVKCLQRNKFLLLDKMTNNLKKVLEVKV